MTRHLWLIRHGKSDWSSAGQSDFERPLNPRGHRNGQRMQEWYADAAHPPEWIWCSAAERTRQTCRYAAAGFRVPDECVLFEQGLYLASPDTLLDQVRATPDDVSSVAVIAHNPGISQLISLLADDPALADLPTFATACFASEAAWQDSTPEGFTLDAIVTPKGLKS